MEFIPLFSGVASGTVVAVLGYFFTKRKTSAEIEKISSETKKALAEVEKIVYDKEKTFAEIEKIKAETEKIRKEILDTDQNVAAEIYQSNQTSEKIIYDSSKSFDIGFDFKGQPGRIHIGNKPVTIHGEGTLTYLQKKVINLQRSNIEGRYEIWLHTYMLQNGEKDYIPKDETINGKRKIRISFEAKLLNASDAHTLKFVFKSLETSIWLGSSIETKVTKETWESFNIYVLVSPKEDCRFRIDDQDLIKIPSSVQIQNLVLSEKV